MYDESDEIFQQLVASVQGHEDLLSSSGAIMLVNNGPNGDNNAPSQLNTTVPGDNSALQPNPTNNGNPNQSAVESNNQRRVPLVTVTFVNNPLLSAVTPTAATLVRDHAIEPISIPTINKVCTVTPSAALSQPAAPARRVALVNQPAISHLVRKTLRKYADVYAAQPNRPAVIANNNNNAVNNTTVNNVVVNSAAPVFNNAQITASNTGINYVSVTVQQQVPVAQPQNRISYYAYNYHNKVKPRDKLSPSHIPVSKLQIGEWSRQSQFVGDTMCKFLYNKKELVWEMLHSGGLKYKILIHYSDVTGFDFDIPNSVFAKQKAGTVPKTKKSDAEDAQSSGNVSRLVVELSKAPEFFVEINPQPGKNTQWTRTTDFTDGEASRCRYHVLEFNRGHLPHHYQKLLSSDARLKMIVESREVTIDPTDVAFRPARPMTDVNNVSSVFVLPSVPSHTRPHAPPVNYINTHHAVQSSALNIAVPLHVVPAHSVFHY